MHLAYFDKSNLYDSILCRPLPHSSFLWLKEDELQNFINSDEILKLDYDRNYGYLLGVDLDYPQEMHETTSHFPHVVEDMFSLSMKSFYTRMKKNIGSIQS